MLFATFTKSSILRSKVHMLVKVVLSVASVCTCSVVFVECAERILSVGTNIHKIVDFDPKNAYVGKVSFGCL